MCAYGQRDRNCAECSRLARERTDAALAVDTVRGAAGEQPAALRARYQQSARNQLRHEDAAHPVSPAA